MKMKNNNLVPLLVKTISLLLFGFGVTTSSFAQPTEVVVVVTGPWAYVTDPGPPQKPAPSPARLVVMSPVDVRHFPAAISSGADFGDTSGEQRVRPGSYQLEISNLACPGPTTSYGVNLFPIPGVSPSTIKTAVNSPGKRFAFSLPMPCSFTELSQYDRHSALDLKPITDPDGIDRSYTTALVLHYFVTTVSPAVLNGTSDDNLPYTNIPFPFVSEPAGSTASIRLIMRGPDNDDGDDPCDSISEHVVHLAGDPFTNNLHVWMPAVDGFGNQQGYEQDCQDRSPNHRQLDKGASAAQSLVLIRKLQEFAELAPAKRAREADGARKALEQLRAEVKDFPPPPKVSAELKAAEQRLDSFIRSQPAGNPKQKVGPQATVPPPLFPSATSYYLMLTPTTGDCRGAQLNIDGVVP